MLPEEGDDLLVHESDFRAIELGRVVNQVAKEPGHLGQTGR